MTSSDAAYAWINDSVVSEAGTVTLVPAADRPAVLRAFGAVTSSGRVVESVEALDLDTGSGGPIYVAEVGEALLVVENNGFQGSRVEVLRPASRASDAHVAASFFWNVEALTAFSAARRGKPLFSVELIGADEDELDGVPKRLRRLVVEGGSEHRDLLGTGLALVADFLKLDFGPEALTGGTVYDLEPVPADLSTYAADYQYTYGLPDVAGAIAALSPRLQRRLAEWATTAAVLDAAMADDPTLGSVLDQFGTGEPPVVPPTLDGLARSTAKRRDHFADLEVTLETGGFGAWPKHPYYEATATGMFGDNHAISHLEGAYLSQRASAVEAVRYSAHPDPLSAAIACVGAASLVFVHGRAERGWTFTENESGRWRDSEEPIARHQAFVRIVSTLIAQLDDPAADDRAFARATAELPSPLTEQERQAAIRADAQAAAEGAFDTYQTVSTADPDDDDLDYWAD